MLSPDLFGFFWRTRQKARIAMITMAATPPTAPPTMAPMGFGDGGGGGGGIGVGDAVRAFNKVAV